VEEGSVKWFSEAKGYGVILRDKGGEIFVHQAAILAAGAGTLQEGQRVQYAAIRGLKGLQAENVQGL
jgi:CspA family cold shock protein